MKITHILLLIGFMLITSVGPTSAYVIDTSEELIFAPDEGASDFGYHCQVDLKYDLVADAITFIIERWDVVARLEVFGSYRLDEIRQAKGGRSPPYISSQTGIYTLLKKRFQKQGFT